MRRVDAAPPGTTAGRAGAAVAAVLDAPRAVHAVAVAVVAALLYVGCLRNGFDFDTPVLVLENESVHGLTAAHLRAVFGSVANTVEWLPVRDVTYMLDYELFGMSPGGYHLSNVVFYALACAACYLFLERLLRRWSSAPRGLALVATLLFAVHPVHVESVAGIAQRKDVVSGFFFFCALLAFLAWRERRHLALFLLALAASALAMLSKATAVVLPAVAFLLVLPDARRERGWIWQVSAFALVAGGIGVAHTWIAAATGALNAQAPALHLRLLTYSEVAFYYLRMLLLGRPLTVVHELAPVASASDPVGLAALLGLAVLVAGIVLASRRRPVPAFAGAWFLVTIAPVAGLVPAPNLVADRYLFVPAAGFALAAAWALAELLRRGRARAFAVGTAAVVLGFSGMSVARARDWRTNESLLVADLASHPTSLRLTQSLGRYHFVNERYDRAFEYFAAARRLAPNDPDLAFFTALRQLQLGNPAGALEALGGIGGDRVIDVNCLYGMTYETLGRPGDAAAAYRRALGATEEMGIFFKMHAKEALRRLGQPVP